MPIDKTCPYKQGFTFDPRINAVNVIERYKLCDGKTCQLWVNAVQNRVIQAGQTKFADPEHEYRYEGCGLLQTVPWELCKIERKEVVEK